MKLLVLVFSVAFFVFLHLISGYFSQHFVNEHGRCVSHTGTKFHAYAKTTGKIIAFCVVIVTFLDNRREEVIF
jgi:hypothetical protein